MTASITNSKTFATDQVLSLTFGGGATYGTHYTVTPADGDTNETGHQVTLAAGQDSVAVTVAAEGNDTADGDRDITIAGALGGASFGSPATIALRDDDNTPATGVPTIRGTAQVGETLSASTDGITDPDGKPANASDYTYQWQSVDEDGTSNETDIGTDSSTYTPVAADVGKRIRVKVSFTDDVGHSEGPLTSAATAAVTPVPVTIEAEHTSIGGGLEDLVYTLTRAGDTADALSVTVTLTQDETWLTAANLSHTVTFNAGEAEKGLTIPAADFSLAPTAKGDLTATVSVDGVGGDSVDVEVISIDHEPVTIAFDKTAYSFPESGAAEEVDIYLTATVDAAFPRPPVEDLVAVIGSLVPGTATVSREDFVVVLSP